MIIDSSYSVDFLHVDELQPPLKIHEYYSLHGNHYKI